MIASAPTRRSVDKVPFTLALLIGLMLSGIGFLAPRTHAQSAPTRPVSLAVKPPVPAPADPGPAAGHSLAIDDDGDGDELMEHWGNPVYFHEERKQLGGLAVVFVLLGVAAYRRQQKLRKAYRDV